MILSIDSVPENSLHGTPTIRTRLVRMYRDDGHLTDGNAEVSYDLEHVCCMYVVDIALDNLTKASLP